MIHRSSWLVLLPLCLACGASQAPPAPVSAPPTPATASAPEVRGAPAVSPADRELSARGLTRTDAKAAVSPPNWAETRASLYILARTRGGQVALVGSGAQLHTGEQIELHVSVGRPSYVYLIQISPNEQTTILYPAEGESDRMLPGTDYRMPTSSEVRFELNENVGTERLAFVVTEQPLATGDADVRALIEQLRATGHWPAEPERAATSKPTAGGAPEKERARPTVVAQAGPIHGAGGVRGFIRKTTGTGRALDVQPDQAGVALAFFTFDHIP
jgi:Domain of unknown function (DUF4384)